MSLLEELHSIPSGIPDAPRNEDATNPLGYSFGPPTAIRALVPERTHIIERREDLSSEFNAQADKPLPQNEKKRWTTPQKPTFPCVYDNELVRYTGQAMALGVRRVDRASEQVIKKHGYHNVYDGDTTEHRVMNNHGFYNVGGVITKTSSEDLYLETLLRFGNSRVASWVRVVSEDEKMVVEVRYRRGDGMGKKLVLGIGMVGQNRVEFDAGRLLCDETVRVGILLFGTDVWWFINGALVRWVRISEGLGKTKVCFGRDGEFGFLVDSGITNLDERREFLTYYVRVWEVQKKRKVPFPKSPKNCKKTEADSSTKFNLPGFALRNREHQ